LGGKNMQRTLVKDALAASGPLDAILLQGWVRTRRDAKAFSFLEINDGSSLRGIQVIADAALPDYAHIQKANTGASLEIRGKLVRSQGQGQQWEVVAESFTVVGEADATYPLQKKGHTLEFLREIAHLRPRSNLFGAVFRVRSRLAFAIHDFFQRKNFVYVHTPIITASDTEGAGELFRVTTLDVGAPPRTDSGAVDDREDFFAKPTFLTVSGQLNGEAFALGLSDIYTFGPTFRAENSNTSRHAAEFWMIEPEMAWYDLDDDCRLAEDFVKFLLRAALDRCAEDLRFFDERIDKGLIARLEAVANAEFARITYTEAVEILHKSGQKFEYPVAWGKNLQAEHERFITEQVLGKPTFVIDYPKEIKAFYMRRNDDDKTVAAMDLLVPKVGELIGGSQREERLDVLQRIFAATPGLDPAHYDWYLDTRRYGTAPHAGFGLGFERLVMYVTGMENIRDVIPFPRTPRNCEF
jgi:asparaginyl-tRNA synthetase